MFSKRTQWDLSSSALADAWTVRQRSAEPVFDLSVSNPTAAGLKLDSSAIAAALSASVVAPYQPIPFGLPSARQAVADYYQQDHRIAVPVERLLLTVSTSEAYSFLFRLLCDQDDEVLYCQPSYPLFDFLADLDAVKLRPLSLYFDGGHDGSWHLDRTALQSAVNPRGKGDSGGASQ